ncbi:hypothetical protein Goshw_024487, partial [Gossypium schwendimanii]|nr:hypothetical protein [Gossypium schwendimanii]
SSHPGDECNLSVDEIRSQLLFDAFEECGGRAKRVKGIGLCFHRKKFATPKPKIVDKPSFTWSSINEAAKVLKDGFGWQNDENKRWNKDRVHAIYGNFLGDRICNLLIGDKDQRDRVVWFHNHYGFYYSKSAYSWLILKQVGFGPHRFLWKAFWKLKTLPKIRVFIWQVGHEILLTNAKIASI